MNPWPRYWDRLVEKAFGKGTRVVYPRFFESKKNQVTLLSLARGSSAFEVMAKHFVWGQCEHAFNILQRAHAAALAVPRPLCREENVCFFEHIPGPSLRKISVESPENLEPPAIGRWLARFHRSMKTTGKTLLRGDCVLTNFIVAADGVLHGIDFEEAGPGDVLDELAQMAVSLLICRSGSVLPNLSVVRSLADAYREESAAELSWDSLRSRMEADLETRVRHMPARIEEFRTCARLLREPADVMARGHE